MNCPFCHKIDQEEKCQRCGLSLPKSDPREDIFRFKFDFSTWGKPMKKTVSGYWYRKQQPRGKKK